MGPIKFLPLVTRMVLRQPSVTVYSTRSFLSTTLIRIIRLNKMTHSYGWHRTFLVTRGRDFMNSIRICTKRINPWCNSIYLFLGLESRKTFHRRKNGLILLPIPMGPVKSLLLVTRMVLCQPSVTVYSAWSFLSMLVSFLCSCFLHSVGRNLNRRHLIQNMPIFQWSRRC